MKNASPTAVPKGGNDLKSPTQSRCFGVEKYTKNKTVIIEDDLGEPQIFGALYIAKWWAGTTLRFRVTIEKLDEGV